MFSPVTFETPRDLMRRLQGGIIGYALQDRGRLCRLLLAQGGAIDVGPAERGVAPSFECFTLALKPAVGVADAVVHAWGFDRGTCRVSVLVREEFIEPYDGDTTLVIGPPPYFSQDGVRPGHVPGTAVASCTVEYGLLFETNGEALAICTDWFPGRLEVTAERERIAELLSDSEAVPLPAYVEAEPVAIPMSR